jgi:uncharacterized membrane protein (UPF0127 family)
MKFINKKNQKIIADNIKIADNFFTRTAGLLGKTGLQYGEGLWIKPCNSIHSIGMKFEFDAVFLDKNLKIVYLLENMKPYRLSSIIFKAFSVLELSAGKIKEINLEIGDEIISVKTD